MRPLNQLLNPKLYLRFAWRQLQEVRLRFQPNLRGAALYPAGHFYSPLLDIKALGREGTHLPFDGPEWWDSVELNAAGQREYYRDLIDRFPLLPFPAQPAPGYRYFMGNSWFVPSDAFTLSGVIRKEKPRRIVEVGSGFSSAVILDTLKHTQASAALTFIEPYPERLYSLVAAEDRSDVQVLVQPVQEVPLQVFDQLEAHDVLFIDSSHVAKIGSDVSFLVLRILPRLHPGVLVHFHDMFYPFSYPADWIREGRAWNESLFLRAFLIGNNQFEVVAFNSYAASEFTDMFRKDFPAFLRNAGGSIWLRKLT